MVEIIIDGVRCDVWEGYAFPKSIFRLDVAAAADVEKQRDGHSVEVVLPSTPTNDEVMCHATSPHAAELFNATLHEAVVRVDGAVLLRGVAHLMAIERESGRLSYRVRLRRGGSEWVDNASLTPLAAAVEGYDVTLNGATIMQSWYTDTPVRYLPVLYDDYRPPYDEHTLYPPERVMTVGDYYPFISVERLLREAVARGCGAWRLYPCGRLGQERGVQAVDDEWQVCLVGWRLALASASGGGLRGRAYLRSHR